MMGLLLSLSLWPGTRESCLRFLPPLPTNYYVVLYPYPYPYSSHTRSPTTHSTSLAILPSPPTRSTLKGVRIFSFLFFFFCFVCVCVCVWDSLECFSVIFLWIQYASYWLLPLQSVSVPSPFHDLCSSCRVTWIWIGACGFCFLGGFRFSFFSSYSVYYFHFICFAPRFDYPTGSLSNT